MPTQIFDVSGAWMAPPGVTKVRVVAFGGGAAGTWGRPGLVTNGGSGGGGGAYVRTRVDVIPGHTYTVHVAGVVASVSTADTSELDGDASWFGSVTTAFASGGHAGRRIGTSQEFTGGQGGQAADCVGDERVSGMDGLPGQTSDTNAYGGNGGDGAHGGLGGTGSVPGSFGVTGGAFPGGGGGAGEVHFDHYDPFQDEDIYVPTTGGIGARGAVSLSWGDLEPGHAGGRGGVTLDWTGASPGQEGGHGGATLDWTGANAGKAGGEATVVVDHTGANAGKAGGEATVVVDHTGANPGAKGQKGHVQLDWTGASKGAEGGEAQVKVLWTGVNPGKRGGRARVVVEYADLHEYVTPVWRLRQEDVPPRFHEKWQSNLANIILIKIKAGWDAILASPETWETLYASKGRGNYGGFLRPGAVTRRGIEHEVAVALHRVNRDQSYEKVRLALELIFAEEAQKYRDAIAAKGHRVRRGLAVPLSMTGAYLMGALGAAVRQAFFVGQSLAFPGVKWAGDTLIGQYPPEEDFMDEDFQAVMRATIEQLLVKGGVLALHGIVPAGVNAELQSQLLAVLSDKYDPDKCFLRIEGAGSFILIRSRFVGVNEFIEGEEGP